MRNFPFLICLFFLGPFLNAQIFEVDTLLLNGDVNKYINIVVMGDGYVEDELDLFSEDAENFVNSFFLESPFQEYKNYFNVFAIRVPSMQSGADHPGDATDEAEPVFPIIDVNTVFGSTFDYFGIHRLLVPLNSFMVNTVLAENFPLYDQPLIIVNSPYYGGSGGAIPAASTNISSAEIIIHELGHSFASLSDEYWAGEIYAAETANMTQETDPTIVKWKNWMGDNSIGTYAHCCGGSSADWYRPHNNCKMRFLNAPFCSVCKEAIIEKIHSLVDPLESVSPEISVLMTDGEPVEFSLNLIKPEPNTLKTIWTLNDEIVAHNVDSIQVDTSMLIEGTNALSVFIEDTTLFIRKNDHNQVHFASSEWEIERIVTPVDTMVVDTMVVDSMVLGQFQLTDLFSDEIELYPNPAGDYLNLKVSPEIAQNIGLNIYDVTGKKIKSLIDFIGYDNVFKINLSGISNKVIIVEVLIDQVPCHTEQIIRH